MLNSIFVIVMIVYMIVVIIASVPHLHLMVRRVPKVLIYNYTVSEANHKMDAYMEIPYGTTLLTKENFESFFVNEQDKIYPEIKLEITVLKKGRDKVLFYICDFSPKQCLQYHGRMLNREVKYELYSNESVRIIDPTESQFNKMILRFKTV